VFATGHYENGNCNFIYNDNLANFQLNPKRAAGLLCKAHRKKHSFILFQPRMARGYWLPLASRIHCYSLSMLCTVCSLITTFETHVWLQIKEMAAIVQLFNPHRLNQCNKHLRTIDRWNVKTVHNLCAPTQYR
jgi:hypothetical protein